MEQLANVFILFIIYSFIGWLIEVVYTYLHYHKLSNRGFLIGPICPIYGIGGLLLIVLLSKYINDPITIFLMSIVLFAILEYLVSFLMEKIFHARWWNYSDRKFNINGRVCLETIIPFGILGLITMYFIHPFFVGVLQALPSLMIFAIATSFAAVFFADLITSLVIITKYKITVKKIKHDSTDEITRQVRKHFLESNILKRRLVKAFPKAKIAQKKKKGKNGKNSK